MTIIVIRRTEITHILWQSLIDYNSIKTY